MMCANQIIGGNPTFEQNLENNTLPDSSSLSYGDIFSKYTFDVGKNETNELVDISLVGCRSRNIFTNEDENFIGIGLLSSEDGKNKREDVNLIIVLDVSGSMDCNLSTNPKTSFFGLVKTYTNKIDIAKECVKKIFSKLKKNETLGLILFNEKTQVLLPLTPISDINKSSFFQDINKIKADNGTNIEIGYVESIKMMKDFLMKEKNPNKNNRIIFITDAIPTYGSEFDVLYSLNCEASAFPNNIFTTFIGVGIDFNTDLVSKLTKVRGSNYFSVKSDDEFIKTLEKDFNYIITPICFDVYSKLEASNYTIEKTYGSQFDFDGEEKLDFALEMKKGGVLRIETLLAYEKSKEGVKGGIILIKLKKNEIDKDTDTIKIQIDYNDINGKTNIIEKKVLFSDLIKTSGIKKAILLSRYVETLKNILTKTQKGKKEDYVKDDKDFLNKFKSYFESEAKEIGDPLLKEEIKIIDSFIKLI